MKQDEIIHIAKESGAVERYFGNQLHGIAFHKKEWLERFFNLAFAAGAAQERENVQMVRAITLEEAAQLCMDYGREGFSAHVIARAIREMK